MQITNKHLKGTIGDNYENDLKRVKPLMNRDFFTEEQKY